MADTVAMEFHLQLLLIQPLRQIMVDHPHLLTAHHRHPVLVTGTAPLQRHRLMAGMEVHQDRDTILLPPLHTAHRHRKATTHHLPLKATLRRTGAATLHHLHHKDTISRHLQLQATEVLSYLLICNSSRTSTDGTRLSVKKVKG